MQRSLFFNQARAFSSGTRNWLHDKMAQSKDSTVAIVAHQDDIKAGVFDEILPNGSELAKSEEFLADLKMSSAYWFYHNSAKRVLLLQKTADKEDEKPEKVKKAWRSLGATACSALQGKKVDNVTLLMTAKASENPEHLGIFHNSLSLSNYENVFKKAPEDNESEAKDDEPVDPRTKKVTKSISNIKVITESDNLAHEDAKF